jgi:hypothetical protein
VRLLLQIAKEASKLLVGPESKSYIWYDSDEGSSGESGEEDKEDETEEDEEESDDLGCEGIFSNGCSSFRNRLIFTYNAGCELVYTKEHSGIAAQDFDMPLLRYSIFVVTSDFPGNFRLAM